MTGKKGSNLGNNNAMKFKSSKDRKRLCAEYILHVRSGLSVECFPLCDPQTLRKYVEQFPSDFDIGLMEQARRERIQYWETIGRDGTIGKIRGFNAKSWQFNMQNRAGWKERSAVEQTNVVGYEELEDSGT